MEPYKNPLMKQLNKKCKYEDIMKIIANPQGIKQP